jgi:hypothetical protein
MGTRREDLKRACLEYLSHLIELAWCSGKIPNADIIATISVSWELPIYVITEDLKEIHPGGGGRGDTMKNTNPHYPRWDGLINPTDFPPTVVQGLVQTRSPGYPRTHQHRTPQLGGGVFRGANGGNIYPLS